jgi:hypothetical protein
MRQLTLLWILLTGLAQGAYYPHGSGWAWRYSSGELQTMKPLGSGVWELIHSFSGIVRSIDLLRYTPQGIYLVGLIADGQEELYQPALELYPSGPLYVGEEWGGQSRFEGHQVRMFAWVEGLRGISTPAGRFNAFLLRISWVVEGGGEELLRDYFVPGLGVVRYEVPGAPPVDLIAVTPGG